MKEYVKLLQGKRWGSIALGAFPSWEGVPAKAGYAWVDLACVVRGFSELRRPQVLLCQRDWIRWPRGRWGELYCLADSSALGVHPSLAL